MSYLSQLPFDVLKIDKSFIDLATSEKANSKLINAIISMGKSLGLEVLAEGVETSAQQKHLIANSCDTVQGYLFSKPLPAKDIDAMLSARSTITPCNYSATL